MTSECGNWIASKLITPDLCTVFEMREKHSAKVSFAREK